MTAISSTTTQRAQGADSGDHAAAGIRGVGWRDLRAGGDRHGRLRVAGPHRAEELIAPRAAASGGCAWGCCSPGPPCWRRRTRRTCTRTSRSRSTSGSACSSRRPWPAWDWPASWVITTAGRTSPSGSGAWPSCSAWSSPTHLYQVWPNSTQFVRTFSAYLKPHARYLVEVPEVPIYYLLGHKDAQPRQFTSTFYINYRNSKGVLLTGTVGFTAAVNAGYFHVVAYNNEITGPPTRSWPRPCRPARTTTWPPRSTSPTCSGPETTSSGSRDTRRRRPRSSSTAARSTRTSAASSRNGALSHRCAWPGGPAPGGLSWCRRSRSALPSCPATRSGWWGWRTGTGRRGTRRPSRG